MVKVRACVSVDETFGTISTTFTEWKAGSSTNIFHAFQIPPYLFHFSAPKISTVVLQLYRVARMMKKQEIVIVQCLYAFCSRASYWKERRQFIGPLKVPSHLFHFSSPKIPTVLLQLYRASRLEEKNRDHAVVSSVQPSQDLAGMSC